MIPIPDAALVALKCFSCENHLSFFPIMMSKEGKSFCGRCTLSEEQICSRNITFETLAELMYFPCRYYSSGCNEYSLPGEIPEHENSCDFKPSECPISFFNSCEWKGLCNKRLDHCKSVHSDIFLKTDNFEIEGDDHKSLKILEHKDKVYFLKHEFSEETDLLDFLFITCTQKLTQVVLRLKLYGDIGDVLIECVPVLNDDHNKLISYRSFSKYLRKNKSKKLICKVRIIPSYEEDFDSSNEVTPVPYNTAPSASTISREHLLYYCEFEKNGCKVVSNFKNMNDHNDVCGYRITPCPWIACLHKTITKQELDLHLKVYHNVMFYRCGQKLTIDFSQGPETCRQKITMFAGHCFLITTSYTRDSKIVCHIKSFTYANDLNNQILFTVDIIDCSNRNQNMILSAPFKDDRLNSYTSIEFMKSQTETFMGGREKLYFKFYLSRYS